MVDAATGLADASGLDALTMRRVAEALGVAPMTLYTYVPGKAELLDLMLDAAYTRMPRASTAGRPWRERLTAVVAENRELYRVHAWAAQIATNRPVLGPGTMGKYEHELSALDGLGLSDVEMDDALTYLLSFVQAWARTAAAQRPDDQAWWDESEPLLARVFDATAYPTAVRVGGAAGTAHGSAYAPEHAFRFGLARVLDGLAVLIEG